MNDPPEAVARYAILEWSREGSRLKPIQYEIVTELPLLSRWSDMEFAGTCRFCGLQDLSDSWSRHLFHDPEELGGPR